MENQIYEEDFVKRNVLKDTHSIQYVLDQIAEVHNEKSGWVVGKPSIIPNSDGKTVTIKVHLKKYPKEETYGRSM